MEYSSPSVLQDLEAPKVDKVGMEMPPVNFIFCEKLGEREFWLCDVTSSAKKITIICPSSGSALGMLCVNLS